MLVAAREVDARLAGALVEAALARVEEAVARDVAAAVGEDAELQIGTAGCFLPFGSIFPAAYFSVETPLFPGNISVGNL